VNRAHGGVDRRFSKRIGWKLVKIHLNRFRRAGNPWRGWQAVSQATDLNPNPLEGVSQ